MACLFNANRLGTGSDGPRSDPPNRSSGYNRVPLNQNQTEYHQQQPPFNQVRSLATIWLATLSDIICNDYAF